MSVKHKPEWVMSITTSRALMVRSPPCALTTLPDLEPLKTVPRLTVDMIDERMRIDSGRVRRNNRECSEEKRRKDRPRISTSRRTRIDWQGSPRLWTDELRRLGVQREKFDSSSSERCVKLFWTNRGCNVYVRLTAYVERQYTHEFTNLSGSTETRVTEWRRATSVHS